MGGHAVRFYGLVRYTNDFDLHIAPSPWDDLVERLASCSLFASFPISEGPSWRTRAFKRFRIGSLPDGSDEWLEFWRENHLLDAHAALLARSQRGIYGNREIGFLGLPDLIRSKETEREKDWADVSQLEEFLDARLHAAYRRGEITLESVLKQLRSRSGFGLHVLEKSFERHLDVSTAVAQTRNPITQAYLIPYVPDIELSPLSAMSIDPLVLSRLKQVSPASPLHIALVEVVRRRYIAWRRQIDREDKEKIRSQIAQD